MKPLLLYPFHPFYLWFLMLFLKRNEKYALENTWIKNKGDYPIKSQTVHFIQTNTIVISSASEKSYIQGGRFLSRWGTLHRNDKIMRLNASVLSRDTHQNKSFWTQISSNFRKLD